MNNEIIRVYHKELAGWHIFDSHDLPGLYVGHVDYNTAFSDIPNAIKAIIKHNFDIDVTVHQVNGIEGLINHSAVTNHKRDFSVETEMAA